MGSLGTLVVGTVLSRLGLAGVDLDCGVLFVVPLKETVLLVVSGRLAVTIEGCLTNVPLRFSWGFLIGSYYGLEIPPEIVEDRWHG